MPLQPLPIRDITPDDLDPKKDPSLGFLNQVLRTHAQAIANLQGSSGPIKMNANLDLNGNRIINVGAAQSSTDVLTQAAADPMYSQKVQQAAMEAVGTK